MATLTLDRLSKLYPGKVQAVKDLSLEVGDGEFLTLVGPSGCGKSTTLRMIAGLEEVSAGDIFIGQRQVTHEAPKDRDIAMVFQDYALYPHMTVYKNMAFALKIRGLEKADLDKRVRAAADILGIAPYLQRKPAALSGGQRQRVALGRAIVREPAAFLFDEPLSNLDAKLRVQTRAELKRLHKNLRTTTVYVTHDQEEAMTLGDRVAVIHEGVLQQCAAPLEIYRRPRNRFVAGFLGSPPMNFLSGRIDTKESRFEGQGMSLDIPSKLLHAAEGRGSVVLGLRPEAFQLRAADSEKAHQLAVDVVEPLGHLMDLTLSTKDGSLLRARLPARPMKDGSVAHFTIDPTLIYLFEDDHNGRNLDSED